MYIQSIKFEGMGCEPVAVCWWLTSRRINLLRDQMRCWRWWMRHHLGGGGDSGGGARGTCLDIWGGVQLIGACYWIYKGSNSTIITQRWSSRQANHKSPGTRFTRRADVPQREINMPSIVLNVFEYAKWPQLYQIRRIRIRVDVTRVGIGWICKFCQLDTWQNFIGGYFSNWDTSAFSAFRERKNV